MVFVPPDRTARHEAVSRVVAVASVVVAACACLAIVAFSGDDGPARIAVVHRAAAIEHVSRTPASMPATTGGTPVRTLAQLRARFPRPANADRVAATSVWRAHLSLAATRAFYLRRLPALGVTWHPTATRSGTRVSGWAGPARSMSGVRLARLEVHRSSAGTSTIALSP